MPDHDLAELLIRVIDQQREQINASRVAHGEPGRIEIHVNPGLCRVDLQVVVRDRTVA